MHDVGMGIQVLASSAALVRGAWHVVLMHLFRSLQSIYFQLDQTAGALNSEIVLIS